MYILYSLLLACGLLLTLPWWIFQLLRSGKYRAGLKERLGFVPARLSRAVKPGAIWLHAVSVGEVLAITNLVRELERTNPQQPVFVSTTTQTGQYLARGRFGEDKAFFLPVDSGISIRPYLNVLRPSLLILAETEFWPNLLHLTKKRGAAIAVVNARVSDRSFPRYCRFRWFFSRVLAPVDVFMAQTEEDARRLIAIGAPAERVKVSGNLKFDVRPTSSTNLVEDLRRALPAGSPVVVCGSTAEGEEEILLKAFQECLKRYPAAVMILAPRHPERFDRVADLVSSMGIALVRRSSWNSSRAISGAVFLLDSVGELASVYALASVAFVGGSLFPVGGHNILEPAQYGVAIMTGPYTFNFREIIRIFVHNDALKAVTPQTLSQELMALLQDENQRKLLSGRARELFTRYSGATQKTLSALQLLIRKEERAAP
ncbi:MAG TPA: 3-deoxy-D-manno-octulosonic acid transferase [Candidatus Angelobacter sp.]